MITKNILYERVTPGEGHLVHFSDRMCTPFRVSLSPPYSYAGFKKKEIFPKPVVKNIISVNSVASVIFIGL